MSLKERVQAATEAAESVVEIAVQKEKIKEAEQRKKELLIAQCHEVIGRVQATDMMSKFGNVAGLVWLKQIRESKIYKDLPDIGSWETFCNHCGKSRRKVDLDLQNLDKFGEKFLATVAGFSVSYKDLRKLRKSVSDGDMIIEGEYVVIGEEKILLAPDSKDDLEAAFEMLVEDRDRQIEEADLTLKAKDRLLKQKSGVIHDQEKELHEFKAEIEKRDYKPGEKEFIQFMENQQIIITGLFLELDPERLPEKATPLMISKYIEVLGYFKRTAQAYHDTALDTHAQPDDITWRQPADTKDIEVVEVNHLFED